MVSNEEKNNLVVTRLAERLKVSRNTLQNVLSAFSIQFHSRKEVTRSGKERTYCCPHKNLRLIQKKINEVILRRTSIPSSMHGYVAKRSILTNARCHIGRRYLLKLDIRNFFPSIHFKKVLSIFQNLGISKEESVLLARLTTVNYGLPHGFLTSNRLAILTLLTVDAELKKLFSEKNVVWTFYSDDITISANFPLDNFLGPIVRIFGQAGFKVHKVDNTKKVTGLLVDGEKPRLAQKTIRELEAVLHNCRILGPKSQIAKFEEKHGRPRKGGSAPENLKTRIHGRLSYIKSINTREYYRLRRIFQEINWN